MENYDSQSTSWRKIILFWEVDDMAVYGSTLERQLQIFFITQTI